MSRPQIVLMTGLLAMFGMLPMALSHSIGAEIQRPLAVVVIGGLISATLQTPVFLSAYLWIVKRYGIVKSPIHGREILTGNLSDLTCRRG